MDKIKPTFGTINYQISKHINKRGASMLSPEIIGRVNDYYDNAVIYHFLRKEELTIDLGRVMKMYNLDKIKILSEEVQEIKYNEVSYKDLETYQFDSNQVNEPYLLKINSPLTIAIFRQIMEDYIIPNEKSKHRKNGFLSQLTKNRQLIYNLKHKISYYQDPSNWAELEELELGIGEMLRMSQSTSLDEEGDATSYNLGIKAIQGGHTNISLLDLLTLYSLVTNENKFGGDRITNLLFRDIDSPGSISNKFIAFENKVNHSFVDSLIETVSTDENELMNFMMQVFGVQNFRIKDAPKKLYLSESLEPVVNRFLSFQYGDFSNSIIITDNADIADKIGDSIKDNELLIEKLC